VPNEDLAELLYEGEDVLWRGQRSGNLYISRRALFMMGGMLLLGGVVVYSPLHSWAATGFKIDLNSGLAFIAAVGLLLCGVLACLDKCLGQYDRREHYVLTNKRVLVIRPRSLSVVGSFALAELPATTFDGGRLGLGRGTVSFVDPATINDDTVHSIQYPVLQLIDDAWNVFQLAQRAQAAARKVEV
jgi:hypothetical protein